MSEAAATDPKKTKKADDAPVPLHAQVPDMMVTGVEVKESEPQKQARAMREKLGRVVEIISSGEFAMRKQGAALFVAHMAVDVGEDKLAAMSEKEVRAYTSNFRARWPAAWGAAASSNCMGFVRHLKVSGLRGGDGEVDTSDPKAVAVFTQQVMVDYQRVMSQLSAPTLDL
jgi:hypothetical protein